MAYSSLVLEASVKDLVSWTLAGIVAWQALGELVRKAS